MLLRPVALALVRSGLREAALRSLYCWDNSCNATERYEIRCCCEMVASEENNTGIECAADFHTAAVDLQCKLQWTFIIP